MVTLTGGLAAEELPSGSPSAVVVPGPVRPLTKVKWFTQADTAFLEKVRGLSADEVRRRFGRPDQVSREPDGEELWWYSVDGWWKGLSFRNGVCQGEGDSRQTGVTGCFGPGGIGLP
jgi:hypothetical protein